MKRGKLNILITVLFLIAFAAVYFFADRWQKPAVDDQFVPHEHTHEFSHTVTPASCTQQGYTTYKCDCGETYVSDHVSVLEHDYGTFACRSCGLLKDGITYVELSSAEELYALGRILATDEDKAFLYTEDFVIDQDLDKFQYPADVTDTEAKIQYLSTSAYKLTADVSLVLQPTSDKTRFLGIGSRTYPFMGMFHGNGKTVTLSAADTIAFSGEEDHYLGIFGNAKNAYFMDVNVSVTEDILVNQSKKLLMFGSLVGFAYESQIDNCNVTITNAKMGASFRNGETEFSKVHLGGLVGTCELSIIRNATATLTNSTLLAQGYDVSTLESPFAFFSVGGVLGFSNAGSDNANHIGRIGNRLLNCKMISTNDQQQDVLFASIEKGDEMTAGGIVGCSFNNFVCQDCTVEISKGNIVAQKGGQTDAAAHGASAGGIIGRLEHTGALNNCHVTGNELNIIARSPENYTAAGGIVGYDVGPYHRDIFSLTNCSIDGNGTSRIVVEVVADPTVSKLTCVGGIAGFSSYVLSDCTVRNVTLVNTSPNVERIYIGGICGVLNYGKIWDRGLYFEPSSISGLRNCVIFDVDYEAATNAQLQGNIALKY